MSIYTKFHHRWLATLAAVLAAVASIQAQTLDTGTGMVRDQDLSVPAGTARGQSPGAPAGTVRGQSPGAAPRAARATGPESVYVVGPLDVVQVHVFQEDDLLTTARVAQDGTIKFPLIGTVHIAGKTEDAAAQVIGAELAKNYLVNPQVTLQVTEYAKRRYTVLGQVGKPGTYEMPDRDTIALFEAIGNAGGFTRIANLGDITLKRVADGKETLYRLNAKGMAGTRQSSAFEIKPGDVITVGESFF